MIDHVSVQVSDISRSRAFYTAVLGPLHLLPAYTDGDAIGFATDGHAPFWILPAERTPDRELHLAFCAANHDEVRLFHRAAMTVGAEILHAPRVFPEYSSTYFACFVRDPDGHNVEAVCRSPIDDSDTSS